MVIRFASTVCAAVLLTGLLAASPISPDGRSSGQGAGTPAVGGPGARAQTAAEDRESPTSSAEAGAGLRPRTVVPKKPSRLIELPVHQATGKPTWNGRLLVKFHDHAKARAELIPGSLVRRGSGEPIAEVTEILAELGGTARPALRQSVEALRELERRAAARSGKSQPDLAGLVYVDVRPERLLEAARAFNDLEVVEYVEIESTPEQHRQNLSPQFGCGAAGQDSGFGPRGFNNCYTASRFDGQCSALGGGGGCNDAATCDDDIIPTACRFGCNDAACCATVSACLPGCSDLESNQGWDAKCAAYANILCAQRGTVYDAGPPYNAGSGQVPPTYKYDPCFAMRGALFSPPVTQGGAVVIQGQVVPPNSANLVSGGLMRYTLAPDGAFRVGIDELFAVAYPTGSITDEADPDTGVPQQALPDPSLEGAGSLISGGCFTAHPSVGCNQVTCCVYVCRVDPSCCIIGWDENCVAHASNAPIPAPGSPGELFGSPCTPNQLPAAVNPDPDDPNQNFPTDGPTPLLTAGNEILVSGAVGNARGYQTYTVGNPVIDPFAVPGQNGIPAVPVPPPTQPETLKSDPGRVNEASNTGTLAWLNGGYRGGGLDLDGFEDIVAKFGINPVTQARGQNITVAVVDISAYLNHEDIVDVVRSEPGQTPILVNQDPIDPNHGTAVLGVIGAEDNDFGITGIVPGARLNFYPSLSFEEGERLLSAITSALIDLEEGDIICLPIGVNGNAIVSSPGVLDLVALGTSAGITTVCSAGNAGVECNPGAFNSGAVIVGACWPGYRVGPAPSFTPVPGGNGPGGFPGLNYCRFGTSNFDPTDDVPPGFSATDRPVAVSGWGTAVTTLGYGDLFRGVSPSDNPLEADQLRTYTSGQSFEGTSAAAAMIAGWCARLQSFSIAFFGTALPVEDLRRILQSNGTFFQQCGLPYGAAFPGFPEGCAQLGDVVTGGQLARIGGFPRARNTVSTIVATAFSGEEPVDFEIVTGVYESGSAFALREVDGTPLRIASLRRRAGNKGQGFGSALFYPMTGATTDLQISVTSRSNPDAIANFTLQFNSRRSSTTTNPGSVQQPAVLQVIYFYNFLQRRWLPAGFVALGQAPTGGAFAPPGVAREFIRPAPGGGTGTQIFARVYTCGVTGAPYSVLHDQLRFDISIDIFNP